MRRMSQETQHVLFLTKNQPDRHPEQQLEKATAANKQTTKEVLVAYWFVVYIELILFVPVTVSVEGFVIVGFLCTLSKQD